MTAKDRYEKMIDRIGNGDKRSKAFKDGNNAICFTPYSIFIQPIKDDSIKAEKPEFLNYTTFLDIDFADYVEIGIPTKKEITAGCQALTGRKYSVPVMYLLWKHGENETPYVVNARYLKEMIDMTGANSIFVNFRSPRAPYYMAGKKGKGILLGITAYSWDTKERYRLK